MMRISIIITLTLMANTALAGGSIELVKSAVVRSSVITLGDVARISGLDDVRASRLKRLEIGQAPGVGQTKYVPRSYIERRVIDLVGVGLRIRGPARIRVKRRGSDLKGSWLAGRLRATIEGRLPYDLATVSSITIPTIPDCRVPEGSTVRITFKRNEKFERDFIVSLLIQDGDKTVMKRSVSVRINRFTTVYAIADEIRRGHTMGLADITSMRVSSSKVPSDAVTKPEFIVGSVSKRQIRSGEILRQAWFKIPPVIERGDRVRIIARRGRIQLSTFGEALNSAAASAFVRVRNIGSKKVVTGRATGPGIVEMEF
jgi:flagella basal body P-ring formation protein FlgA